MLELSLSTLNVIAWSKIIFFLFLAVLIFLVFKKNKPWLYLLAITAAVAGFYLIFSRPLEKMFWGNNGDEVFIFSFLTKVMAGDYFKDFYYSALPPFYPPLYFWIIGTISKFFTTGGIAAAKIGSFFTLSIWFVGPYLFQKLFWKISKEKEEKSIVQSKWFWLICPIIFFISLDFDAVILKPYETLPALFGVLLIGMISISFDWEKWTWKNYLFLGISGGLLFLTYYFWWFILIPSIFTLALISKQKSKNLLRILLLGTIIFAVASPYLIPLVKSYLAHGMENWQAAFFVPQDFSTFAPWTPLNLKTVIVIAGLIGLIWFRRDNFIKAGLVTFSFAFVYQLINIIAYLAGAKPAQSAKPFLFLGTACLAIGAAYLLIHLFRKFASKLELKFQKSVVLILILIFLPLMPFAKFIDDPVVQAQIEKDLSEPSIRPIADFIKNNIPDYSQRIWLSSGAPEINAYIPMTYYIAHNPHFSHQASNYSKRFEQVEKMTRTGSAEEFIRIIESQPEKIDSLLLYFDRSTDTYPLFFWQDNYPNGGQELRLDLPKNLIDEKYWEKRYNDGEWYIYIRNWK
ncbi:MAG: ArnT family glycosyltransferase [Patescibacteria group bacterium]